MIEFFQNDWTGWETFLRLPLSIQSDLAPEGDPTYLLLKGVEPEAPVVLRTLRDEVAPVVEMLDAAGGGLKWFSFLVHDRSSGVPTTEDDHRAYIHLRLIFGGEADLAAQLPAAWTLTRPWRPAAEMAGIDPNVLDGGVHSAWAMLGEQSKWLLDLLGAMPHADGLTLVRHVRQFLHFYANMAQMRVG